jgi:hypothetical protein
MIPIATEGNYKSSTLYLWIKALDALLAYLQP